MFFQDILYHIIFTLLFLNLIYIYNKEYPEKHTNKTEFRNWQISFRHL